MSAAFPQTGGDNVYEFLDLTYSGLATSLGGTNISITGGNQNLAYMNPALLNREADKSLALNYVNYFAGINYGMAMYSRSIAGTGNFAAGITYLNYGSFIAADETGAITGKFTASEYAFSALYSREVDSSFTLGLNFKPVLSHLEDYTSFGFAFDIGAAWHSSDKLLSAGFVIRNAGMEVTTYSGEKRRSLPFEIQSGATVRLAHAPLRFSVTARHLEKYRLTTSYYPGTGDDQTESSDSFLENLMRHFIIGAELIPFKNFYLSGGYNYQRRQELKTEGVSSAAGFSWGFGIKTSFLELEFGRATYHIAGSFTNISIVVRPEIMFRKSRN